jgi:dolichol kinase
MTWPPMARAAWASSRRYFRIFRRRLLPLVHSRRTIDDIFVSRELPEREEFFERRFNTWRWRLLLNIFFSRFVMGRMGRDKAFFDHVDGSPAQHVARRIRHAGIACDPAENPYLHWIMKGTHGDALPMTWREDHFETIAARLDRLDIRPGSLEAFVSTGERADGFNLSDIFEYMSPDMFATVYESILDAANPGARLVYWNMMAPRRVPPHAAAPGADADRARGSAEGAGQGVLLFRFRHRGGHRVSPAIQITLALGSVGVLLGLMAGVRRMARRLEIGAEVQRKLIHVATGLYALSLPWLFPDRWPVYVLIGVTLVVMLVLRLPNSRLGKTLHGVERQSYGDLLLALSVGLCLFLAGDDLYLYVLPIAVLTLADAAAALAGSTYGTRFFRIEDGRKSVEGSAVFFLITLLISIVCLMLMTPLPPLNILVISMMVAGFGTLVEAASWRGFDNLFLPLGLLIFLSVHAGNSLAELFSFAGLFVASILAFRHVAPLIGLNRHAAHVYVTAVFSCSR